VLWLVDVLAAVAFDASSARNCWLSLRAQPNIASMSGDSPGAPGAPPASELRPTIASIRDTAVRGVTVSVAAAGVVGGWPALSCVAVVVLTNGVVAAGSGVTAVDPAAAGLLTTVCAATRGPVGVCAAPASALAETCFDDELVRDGDVVLVALCAEVFPWPCEPLLFSASAVGGVVVGAVDVPVVPVVPVVVVPVVVPVVVVPVVVVPVVEPAVDDEPPELPVPFEVEDDAPVSPVPESLGCANAIPVVLASAKPTPNATANAPTRPT
jgi:hypothetical protein